VRDEGSSGSALSWFEHQWRAKARNGCEFVIWRR
jgi:hypothetical protein